MFFLLSNRFASARLIFLRSILRQQAANLLSDSRKRIRFRHKNDRRILANFAAGDLLAVAACEDHGKISIPASKLISEIVSGETSGQHHVGKQEIDFSPLALPDLFCL